MQRNEWQIDAKRNLTNAIHAVDTAGLSEAALAMRNAVSLINALQKEADALRTIRELLR